MPNIIDFEKTRKFKDYMKSDFDYCYICNGPLGVDGVSVWKFTETFPYAVFVCRSCHTKLLKKEKK
jgi:hypothetical protein